MYFFYLNKLKINLRNKINFITHKLHKDDHPNKNFISIFPVNILAKNYINGLPIAKHFIATEPATHLHCETPHYSSLPSSFKAFFYVPLLNFFFRRQDFLRFYNETKKKGRDTRMGVVKPKPQGKYRQSKMVQGMRLKRQIIDI